MRRPCRPSSKQAAVDPQVRELMNNIALGYTNVSDELTQELISLTDADIARGRPDDLKEDPSWEAAVQAGVSRISATRWRI